MSTKERNIANFKVIRQADGNCYRFFCGASGGAVYTTKPIKADNPDNELKIAWELAKEFFNLCSKCGRWVCDLMTNADTLECVDCSPWENPPKYCPSCGKKISVESLYCVKCGVQLMYGGNANVRTL